MAKKRGYLGTFFWAAPRSAQARPGFRIAAGSFSTTLGGGVDMNVSKLLAVRVFQTDYVLTRFGGDSQHNFRASAGLVLRLGAR